MVKDVVITLNGDPEGQKDRLEAILQLLEDAGFAEVTTAEVTDEHTVITVERLSVKDVDSIGKLAEINASELDGVMVYERNG